MSSPLRPERVPFLLPRALTLENCEERPMSQGGGAKEHITAISLFLPSSIPSCGVGAVCACSSTSEERHVTMPACKD